MMRDLPFTETPCMGPKPLPHPPFVSSESHTAHTKPPCEISGPFRSFVLPKYSSRKRDWPRMYSAPGQQKLTFPSEFFSIERCCGPAVRVRGSQFIQRTHALGTQQESVGPRAQWLRPNPLGPSSSRRWPPAMIIRNRLSRKDL